MIIGNGMLANAVRFYDKDEVIFFASGVSNSLEKDPSAFEREIRLLHSCIEENPHKKLIYFSTCSVYDPSKAESPYVKHKLNAEKDHCRKLCQLYYLPGRKCSGTWW